jgi:hypothetical protein
VTPSSWIFITQEDVMEPRFASRLDEMMGQAEVSPELLRDLLPRPTQFDQPFGQDLLGPEQIRHAA